MKIYKYIYYRAYDLISITGNYDLAWGAVHFLSLMEAFCIGLLYNYLQLPNPYDKEVVWHKIVASSAYFVPLIINYYIFLKRRRYLNVINDFKNEARNNKLMGRFTVLLIVAFIIYSLF